MRLYNSRAYRRKGIKMAQVPVYRASVQGGGSNSKLGSASVRVNATDGKAYVAAADATARLATDVGVLIAATQNMMAINGTTGWSEYDLASEFVNDAFAFPDEDANLYRSNKFKVTYATTNGGLPVRESIYIPFRSTSSDLESNGMNVNLADTIPAAYVAALVATGISSYGTAITSVIEITVNDD